MSSNKLRAAVLIVSDTAHTDPSSDRAGTILQNTFVTDGGGNWDEDVTTKIVPDNVLEIQRTVQSWTDGDDFYNLVVTTGGTGFAVKDNTPEAISPLMHRHAPGLVHGMLAASLDVTPFAMMSRPVAGVRNKTLILTLPGSPKGAKESLQAVIKLLPHACTQAAGGDSRKLHAGGVKKLEKEAGVASAGGASSAAGAHSHHHHHHDHSHGHSIPKPHTAPSDRPQSNDPNAGPTNRARESPYPMVSVDEAAKLILQHTPLPQVVEAPVNPSLIGHVLAEDVQADEAVPAYRASIVDGYAVIAPDDTTPNTKGTKGTFPVASVSHAQAQSMPPPLQPNQIARITTGAPLPSNANAVVMVEDTVLTSSTADGSEESHVEILTYAIKPGENVREPGSDVSLRSTVLHKSNLITGVGGEVGLLASIGKSTVHVYRKPRIGVLSTGDELLPHTSPQRPTGGQVRDSNLPSLLSALTSLGFNATSLGIAADTPPGALESALRSGFTGANTNEPGVDIIITTGGVSMGELDLLKPTIQRSLGGTIHFGRVSMKPGKPTTFATIPAANFKDPATGSRASEGADKLIFSLPGNPASALVTLPLFVLPSLHAAMGIQHQDCGLPKVPVTLSHDIKLDPQRPEYHRAIVKVSRDGMLLASSTGGQRSSRVGSLASANALLCLPAREGMVRKGEKIEAMLMGQVVGDF